MEFKLLQYLLNIGFTIIEISLFYGDKQLEAKICVQILDFVGQNDHVYQGQ